MELKEIKQAMLNRIVVEYKGIPYYIVSLSLVVPSALNTGKTCLAPGDEYWHVTLHDLNANSVTGAAPKDITSTGETLLERRRRMNKGGGNIDESRAISLANCRS